MLSWLFPEVSMETVSPQFCEVLHQLTTSKKILHRTNFKIDVFLLFVSRRKTCFTGKEKAMLLRGIFWEDKESNRNKVFPRTACCLSYFIISVSQLRRVYSTLTCGKWFRKKVSNQQIWYYKLCSIGAALTSQVKLETASEQFFLHCYQN